MKAAKRPPILRTSAVALLALAALYPSAARASTLTWTGQVNNFWETNAFSSPTNWNPNTLTPSTDTTVSDLIFTGSRNTNSVNDAPPQAVLNSITFDQNASKFVLSGSAIFIQGGGVISNNSTNLQTISFSDFSASVGGIELSNTPFFGGPTFSSTTITAARGDILITSNISIDSPLALTFDGPHNITVTGAIGDTAAGGGTIVKNGSGTLTLTGNNTLPGNTTINAGTLQLDGSLASRQTLINSAGTLTGVGRVGGALYNNGTVAPGDNGIGTLTVGGNYFQGKGGTLVVEIDGRKSHDLVAVQQHAQLDGTLRIVNLNSSSLLKPGQHVDILTAGAGVSGTFTDMPKSNTLQLVSVVYTPNAVEVEGLSDPFGTYASNAGLTPNQVSVARGLDKIAFRNTQPKLINFLVNEPLSNLPGDFDRIAPEELSSIYTIGVALANVQTANLQRRTEDIRSGSHGFSAAGFATAGSGPLYSGGLAGPNGNEGKESKEVKNVVPEENRWGAFITGVGEWVNVSGDNNARGYDVTTGGFTVGADYKVTPNFAVGISAGYAGTGTDLNRGSRVWVNGGKLGLYATYFTGGGFYVDTAVTGGYNSYDTRRSALQGTARGDTDGGELNVLFGTGYDIKSGGWTFGPTASFQYTYLGISDFTEHGSLAPLSFRSQHQDSLRTAFGGHVTYDWKIGGVVIRPELRAAWQHEFGDDRYAIDSSFAGGNGDLFTVTGPRLGRDSLLLGAGFAILWNDRISTYVYYDGELGRENYEAQNVSGGVRVSF